MPRLRQMNLQFPLAGENRKLAYSVQQPFTTPGCLNVRPVESQERRGKGGKRPGLSFYSYDRLGTGPVNLLGHVRATGTDGRSLWEDYFDGVTLDDHWTAATWVGTAPSLLPKDSGAMVYVDAAAAVADQITTIDTAQDYLVEIFIAPYSGQFHGHYDLYFRLHNTTPTFTTSGARLRLTMTGNTGAYSGTLDVYSASVLTSYVLTPGTGTMEAGILRVLVSGNDISAYWQGNTLISAQTISAAAGTRFGFGAECTVSGGYCLFDWFRLQYFRNDNREGTRSYLVAACDGVLSRETWLGTWETVSSNLSLNSTDQLQAVDSAGVLYIADWGDPIATGTDGVKGTGTTKFDSATYTNWTAVTGINAYDYFLVISAATGDLINGTYRITTVEAAELTLHKACATGATGTCTFRIERGPKQYDPIANTLAHLTASTGETPVGNRAVTRYMDRLVWCAQKNNPHEADLSRASDETDYDYGQVDAEAAVALSATYGGQIGEPIYAAMSHSDNYLVFGCRSTSWTMIGDPAQGGTLHNISEMSGVLSPLAWTRDPDDGLIILGRDGLYYIAAGPTGYAKPISHDVLPREMIDISPDQYMVSIEYDQRDHGVHIYLTPHQDRNRLHFWFAWDWKGFFPVRLPDSHEPWVTLRVNAESPENSCVLHGCRDGWVRRYHDRFETDGGVEIEAYVFIGAVALNGGYGSGTVAELDADLSQDSGPIDWEMFRGDTAEGSLIGTAQASGTWTVGGDNPLYVQGSGMQATERPMVSGRFIGLKLSNGSTDRRWSFEMITASVEQHERMPLA